MDQHTSEAVKHIVDGVSVVTVIGTLANVLPAIAALFTIIWTALRIYETKTVQGWLGNAAPETGDN
jgi:chromate transport protein ChrA